jgi:hypothetical protein
MDDNERRVAEIVAARTGEAPKKKTGRPPKQPRVEEAVIEDLAGVGCTMEELVLLTGLSEDTLSRRFAGVIEKGRASMRMSLRRQQIATATNPRDPAHGTMLVWLGKVLLGQSETAKLEVTGADGGPIAHADVSPEKRSAYLEEAFALVAEAERIATASSEALRETG